MLLFSILINFILILAIFFFGIVRYLVFFIFDLEKEFYKRNSMFFLQCRRKGRNLGFEIKKKLAAIEIIFMSILITKFLYKIIVKIYHVCFLLFYRSLSRFEYQEKFSASQVIYKMKWLAFDWPGSFHVHWE